MWVCLVLSLVRCLGSRWTEAAVHISHRCICLAHVPGLLRTSRDPHCSLQFSKCSKAPWSCILCLLDLSLPRCSEIGFCGVETCSLLARQLVQSRDISRQRELASVNWVTALIKTCLFVFFSGCLEASGHLHTKGATLSMYG